MLPVQRLSEASELNKLGSMSCQAHTLDGDNENDDSVRPATFAVRNQSAILHRIHKGRGGSITIKVKCC
jgi:hypothetical protein